MASFLRQLFRPVYGTHFEVRPKHWWSPRERGNARVAARVLEHTYANGGRERFAEAALEMMLYGSYYVR